MMYVYFCMPIQIHKYSCVILNTLLLLSEDSLLLLLLVLLLLLFPLLLLAAMFQPSSHLVAPCSCAACVCVLLP